MIERRETRLSIAREMEIKRLKAEEYLERCFSGKSNLRITQSKSGNDRVRARLLDVDAYMGYIEDNRDAGIVKLNREGKITFVAEEHYPNVKDKPVFLWEFVPGDGTLLVTRLSGSTDVLQMEIAEQAGRADHAAFERLMFAMASANRAENRDPEFERDKGKLYPFRLEELQSY